MLSYAFTTLNQGGYEDVATEEFENIHNLFAAILAKGIGKQLKQGLYREYLNRKDDITVVRGNIDMPGTIRNRLSRKQVLTCEYDELSENNLFNQILKTTVMLLLRHARVDQEHKNDLKKEMLFFSNVDTIDPTAIRWAAIRFQRNNSTYRMLISLCQLILDGMLLTTDSGEFKLASFVDEQRMNRLYEKFILEYYAKECPWVTATASQIPWALDDGVGPMLASVVGGLLVDGVVAAVIQDERHTRDALTISSRNFVKQDAGHGRIGYGQFRGLPILYGEIMGRAVQLEPLGTLDLHGIIIVILQCYKDAAALPGGHGVHQGIIRHPPDFKGGIGDALRLVRFGDFNQLHAAH